MSNILFLNILALLLLLQDYGKASDKCSCADVCQDDKKELLGQGTWRLLHAMVDNVEPTESNQERFKSLVQSLAYLYPCSECRQHLKQMSLDDVQMSAFWICTFHNKVNERLQKQLHDCNKHK